MKESGEKKMTSKCGGTKGTETGKTEGRKKDGSKTIGKRLAKAAKGKNENVLAKAKKEEFMETAENKRKNRRERSGAVRRNGAGKRLLACFLAFFLGFLSIPFPQRGYAEEPLFMIFLIIQENQTYEYEEAHRVASEDREDRVALQYRQGEKVQIGIKTECSWEKVSLLKENGSVWKEFTEAAFSFQMPGENLTVCVNLQKNGGISGEAVSGEADSIHQTEPEPGQTSKNVDETKTEKESKKSLEETEQGENSGASNSVGLGGTEDEGNMKISGEEGTKKTEGEIPGTEEETLTEEMNPEDKKNEAADTGEEDKLKTDVREAEEETETGETGLGEMSEGETGPGEMGEGEKGTEEIDAGETGLEGIDMEEIDAGEADAGTADEDIGEPGEGELDAAEAEKSETGKTEERTGIERIHQIHLTDSDSYTFVFSTSSRDYAAGETVYFEAIPTEGYRIVSTKVKFFETEIVSETRTVSEAKAVSETKTVNEAESMSETETVSEARNVSETEAVNGSETVSGAEIVHEVETVCEREAEGLTGEQEVPAAEHYSFIMPDSDVTVFCETEALVRAAAEQEEAVIEDLKLIIGAANIGGQLAWVPEALKNKAGFSNIKYVQLNLSDGSSKKVFAYCLQPSLPGPEAGAYDADDLTITELIDDPVRAANLTTRAGTSSSAKSARMAKAMYYLYNGPAWGKDVSDGTKVYNFREMMKQAGCSDTVSGKGYNIYDDYYFMTHMILAYLYLGAEGKWNYATDAAANAVSPALNDKGIRLVETIAGAIDKLPSSTTQFSDDCVEASFQAGGGKLVSKTVTYQAVGDNVAKVQLPGGVTLVNTTTGKRQTGTVSIRGGDSFYLQADPAVSGTVSYTFKTTLATDFSAYKIQFTNKQDIGFAYQAGDKMLTLQVEWPQTKAIEIQKKDKETGKTVPGSGATFLGAQYTVYSDRDCQNSVTVLTTNEEGYAKTSQLPLAVYYVKETKAPAGYLRDETVYEIRMQQEDGIAVYTVSSLEQIIRKPVEIQKYDKETGKASPINDRVTFAGAEYTIYQDEACTQALEVLTTDGNGYAKSSALLPGRYYIKETKAPRGYLKDETVHGVTVDGTAETSVYQVLSHEQVIRKPLEIQKYDKETGTDQPNNSAAAFLGAEYTLYSDAGCGNALEVLVTDEKGYAKSSDLLPGTYYLRETKAPTGYLPDSTVYPVTVEDDGKVSYRISSGEQVIRGSVSLMKYLDDNMEESVLQDLYDSGRLEKIRFTLVHEDAQIPPVELVTNRYGYATTGAEALVYGTWYLTEDPDTIPEGYQGMEKARIEIREQGIERMYVVTNKPYEAYLCIQKKDQDSGALITRGPAEFQILDEQGNAVRMPTFDGYSDTFQTNAGGEIHLTKALKGGKYSLAETKAPEGFEKADPIQFEIKENTIFSEPLILVCEDQPKKGKIRVVKSDKTTGEPCGEGFRFEIVAREDILDGNGAVRKMEQEGKETELTAGTVVSIIQTGPDGAAVSGELYLGSYLVREVEPGEYYANNKQEYPVTVTAQEESMISDVRIENEKTTLKIEKRDTPGNQPMGGVKFALWEKGAESTRMELRTDEKGQGEFQNLKKNTVYCLQEMETLQGFVLDQAIYEVEVDQDGCIEGKPVYTIKLTNQPNVVEISKQDITGGQELPGAVLMIQDEEGNCVERWVSDEKPHKLYGLPAGTYTLTEITAPHGYEIAERITFALSDSYEILQITMYDKPEETETEGNTEPKTEESESERKETEPETAGKEETEEQRETETEKNKKPEKETEKEIVIGTEAGNTPKTGDMTPIAGLLFLAICSMIFGVMEVLRRIRY